MQLDDFQQRWLAQDQRIEKLELATRALQLDAELATPRRQLRWSRIGDALEILLGAAFVLWTGTFMGIHRAEMQFVIPAAVLHLWGIATIGTAVARFYRTGAIDYAAPVVEIQRRLEAVRVFTLRSLRALFLFGVVVWGVPFAIVALRAWLGLDLYALLGTEALFGLLVANGALALLLAIIVNRLSARLDRLPRLQKLVRALAGYNLTAAEDRLATIAAFEREA
jgi:hypothetical protein